MRIAVRVGASDRAAALQPLGLAKLLVLARQRGAVDLATGAPSFPATGADLLDVACTALRDGFNQYDDPAGNPSLRAAAAAVHAANPDTEITITAGATEGLNVVLQALVQDGDEVIVFEPCYEVYLGVIQLAGAKPRFVRLREPSWRWDPDELAAAFGPRTRAVIVNSPHNPTGRIFSTAELAELNRLCAAWNSVLISDEAYVEFVDAPGAAVLPWQVGPTAQIVSLRSLSKSHAISGWRIGWIYAAPDLTRIFRLVHETLITCCAAPLQAAAAHIVSQRPGWSDRERSALIGKRRRLHAAVTAAGLSCDPPQGGPFLFTRLPDGSPGADHLTRTLVLEHGLAVAPGSLFFANPAAGARYLRFAFNKSDEVLDAALDRLSTVAAALDRHAEHPGCPSQTLQEP
jgi:N-succinyldiaminopimelate aminotransferase